MSSLFSPSAVFPPSPSALVPNWRRHSKTDAWPTPETLPAEPPFLFDIEDWEVPRWKRGPQLSSAERQAKALVAVIDTFWRLSAWVDAQGPAAEVRWALQDPPDYNSDPSNPSPSGPPFLVVTTVPSVPERFFQSHDEQSEAMAEVMAGAREGAFTAATPLEDRARLFVGQAYARWLKGQVLEKDLPAASPSRSRGPRF